MMTNDLEIWTRNILDAIRVAEQPAPSITSLSRIPTADGSPGRLSTLLGLHAELGVQEAEPVPALARGEVARRSIAASAEVVARAVADVVDHLRHEIMAEVASAPAELLAQLRVVRAADFGLDGSGVSRLMFDFAGGHPGYLIVGKRSTLPVGHWLLDAILETDCYVPSDSPVYVLGFGANRQWYLGAAILSLTRQWRQPQQDREQQRIDEELRTKAWEAEARRETVHGQIATLKDRVKELEAQLSRNKETTA
jgi:hypothetical protein